MYLATFFVGLLCVLLLQPSAAAPLLHQQSDIIESDVGPAFFDLLKLKKAHCGLMQAVKYPEQVTGPTQTDTHIHIEHRASDDVLFKAIKLTQATFLEKLYCKTLGNDVTSADISHLLSVFFFLQCII